MATIMKHGEFEAIVEKSAEVAAKYNELIMAVGSKYPGETRHETALRYIRRAEKVKQMIGPCCQSPSSVGELS